MQMNREELMKIAKAEVWGGWIPVRERNSCQVNQQPAVMLMLLCLFKLIIKDRATPPLPANPAENFSLQRLASKSDDELPRLLSRPH